MIPLRDENPAATTPVVTRGLIAVNAAFFLYELLLGPDLSDFLFAWGMVPLRVHQALAAGSEPLTFPALSFLSSMFLHGGWLHLLGNMWYLWIFGDNVEDRLGHGRFLLFYLGSGLVAGAVQYVTHPFASVPTVGASGAIAGVLGAYAVAFPRARVVTLVPLFPFFQVIALPALVVLGLWFALQFFSGALSLATTSAGGGIAFWAHIGGFAFGFLVMSVAGRGRSRAWVEP